MKTLKNLLLITLLAFGAVSVPTLFTSCSHVVTLEPGGAYTSPYLAKTDESIVAAEKNLDGFLSWYEANSVFLAKYPDVGNLAIRIAAQKNGWVRDAWAARDAYAEAEKAYKEGSSISPTTAKVNATLSILKSFAEQAAAYRTSHS